MKKKVLIVAPILTNSGYGEHARFIWRALKSREDLFEVYLRPINWGATPWKWEDSEERLEIDSDIGKTNQLVMQNKLLIDINVMVTVANEYKAYHAPNCYNIGVNAGIEGDKVAPEWIAGINQHTDLVITTSEFSRDSIINTVYDIKDDQGNEHKYKCFKPVEVCHYPVKEYTEQNLELDFNTDFNFLCVAQWGTRKNINNTIRWFLEEFGDKEDVGLVLKTQRVKNSTLDRQYVEKELHKIKKNYPKAKCKLYLIHGFLNEDEMHSLYVHPKIKAMINFGHGEGYGLPLFEAAYCGLPVITHDFGGQKDFLYAPKKKTNKIRPHFSRVSYKMAQVPHSAVSKGVIVPTMNWANPDMVACKAAMRELYKNPTFANNKAKDLQKWVLENFKKEDKYSAVIELVSGKEEEDVIIL